MTRVHAAAARNTRTATDADYKRRNISISILMKKHCYILLLLGILTLSGCQSIAQMSVDYLSPADVNFPEQLKRVAVINATPADAVNTLYAKWKDRPDTDDGRSYSRTQYLQGDAAVATEALATALAEGNFFDEVIISDSLIQGGAASRLLTPTQVTDLTQQLGADFLIAVENVPLRAESVVDENTYYGMYIGSTDVKTAPVVRLYFPRHNTNNPAISRTDSIYWENYSTTFYEAKRGLVSEDEMLKQASEFAGTEMAQTLIPSWHTASRYYFAGGSVDMRDAAVSAREHDWERAISLWRNAYDSSKGGKKKMYAAYNLALGYEMTDSLETAVQWAQTAKDLAAKLDKIDESGVAGQQTSSSTRYAMASFYLTQLEKRRDEMFNVRMQMSRFSEDF